jgi:glyoxylase-like metal-dependent hydrolase (beta-lactamase superfamily II)
VAFVKLRGNTGYFTGRGGTIGWYSTPEALVAVDTQFEDTARLFLAGMPGRGQRNLDWVFNTHHHGDHTGGNRLFKAVSKAIVAQRLEPRFQLRQGERDHNLDKQVFADTWFDELWSCDLGAECLSARFFGSAHTGADCVVCFEKANVVHLGDLVFNRMYPVIDRFGGGTVRGWLEVLERIPKEFSDDTLYLFGHGNPRFGVTGGRAELALMRDYLSALLEHVARQVAAGRSRAELIAMDNFPGFEDFHVAPGKGNRLPANLGAVYDELTGTH